jgi:hypothetical protein
MRQSNALLREHASLNSPTTNITFSVSEIGLASRLSSNLGRINRRAQRTRLEVFEQSPRHPRPRVIARVEASYLLGFSFALA